MLDFEKELKKFTPSKEAEPELSPKDKEKQIDIKDIILELLKNK